MRKVFINTKTKTIVIVKEIDYLEYENNSNFFFLCTGTKKECIVKIEEYWEENLISIDEQLILNT